MYYFCFNIIALTKFYIFKYKVGTLYQIRTVFYLHSYWSLKVYLDFYWLHAERGNNMFIENCTNPKKVFSRQDFKIKY